MTLTDDPTLRRKFMKTMSNYWTILGASGGPHVSSDGDLVFSLKLDSQHKGLVNAKNNDKKYAGGIWCEAVCQKANKAPEARHQGDCKCNAQKFTMPKTGQKVRVTGAHVQDLGEAPHAMEIHPITSLEIIG